MPARLQRDVNLRLGPSGEPAGGARQRHAPISDITVSRLPSCCHGGVEISRTRSQGCLTAALGGCLQRDCPTGRSACEPPAQPRRGHRSGRSAILNPSECATSRAEPPGQSPCPAQHRNDRNRNGLCHDRIPSDAKYNTLCMKAPKHDFMLYACRTPRFSRKVASLRHG